MILHRTVQGEPMRLIVLPTYNKAALKAWAAFTASDSILGLDVESTALGELGTFDQGIKTRLIQFGNRNEGWALDVNGPWRPQIVALLHDHAKRFSSHNATFDTTRVHFEFGITLGERSIDTLPMAALCWPGITRPKGLKDLCNEFVDKQLSEAETELHARFVDLYYANKPRKTRLLPVSFEPGVSACRSPRKKGQEKCTEASWEGSLCGYCRHHYLARTCSQPIETWGWNNIALDDPVFLLYAGLDAVYDRRLLDALNEQIKLRKMSKLSRTEQRVKRSMTAMALRGMRVDVEWTEGCLAETEKKFLAAEDAVMQATGGISPRSPKLIDWFGECGIRTRSLDKENVAKLLEAHGDDAEAGPVLRQLQIVSRYSNELSNLRIIHKHASTGDGYVHPNVNTLQAHTGRMSITRPAVQTLAKKGEKGTHLRGCFIARDGSVLVGADYDSQEIRIAAALSRDEMLLRIVMEGLNQHALTAANIFPEYVDKATNPDMYAKAKTLDFAQQYGAMPKKIAKTLKIPEGEALMLWQKWRMTYAGLVRWSEAQSRKQAIRNPFGRLIPRDPYREYASANYMIQSTGRDILGEAIVRLVDHGWGPFIWLPIHDELVLEVPEHLAEEACEALTRLMSTSVEGVPIPAEGEMIGTRWKGLG